MRSRVLFIVMLLTACEPAPPAAPAPVSVAEIQEFARQYVAASNAGDATKLMELVSTDGAVTSTGQGEIERGWEQIRSSTDQSIALAARYRITLGTVDIVLLGPDAGLAVAPTTITPLQSAKAADVLGAVTLIVRREKNGLRLIHEHHSVRTR